LQVKEKDNGKAKISVKNRTGIGGNKMQSDSTYISKQNAVSKPKVTRSLTEIIE
jgi:hypothetical protein